MPIAYELALLGAPTTAQAKAVKAEVRAMLADFGLRLTRDVAWHLRPSAFIPSQRRAAAVAFFGGPGETLGAASGLIDGRVPVVPVVSSLERVSSELPSELRSLNALAYDDVGPRRVATALLECAGLLPRQRRVFLSYRRDEARAAALQLFDALSARRYDVFLDTHGVAPGAAFQTALWHRLCESDVLVMLDTPTYFESRWSSAEFGRALAKGISILGIGWPGVAPSPRAATAARITLSTTELTKHNRTFARSALDRIGAQLEIVRSESIAVRRLNLVSKLANGIEQIGGSVVGIGRGTGVYLRLADGKTVVAYPAVGVPTAETLHEARRATPADDVAVIYDPIGISPEWQEHLDWLGTHIAVPRWVKVTDAAWDFADWRPPHG